MPYFKDADEVYSFIGKLFEDLAEDEELAPKFQKANTIVQYRYRNPESVITVKIKEGEDGQVDLGETGMEPEVVMSMEADTAHRFWLGKVNVTVALARGQMKAKGPVAKILKLVPPHQADLPALPQDARGGGAQGPARGVLTFKDFYQHAEAPAAPRLFDQILEGYPSTPRLVFESHDARHRVYDLLPRASGSEALIR